MAKSNKNAVLLTTATASTLLRPYADSLALSATAQAVVFAVGGDESVAKLQAALPSELSAEDLGSLRGLANTMGFPLLRASRLPPNFRLAALGGSLADATRAAKSLKLQLVTAADFDELPHDASDKAAFALAAELKDTPAAQQKLAKLAQKARETLLNNLLSSVPDPLVFERLRRVADGLDVGVEHAYRLSSQLPPDADLQAFARYHDEFRERTISKTRNKKDDREDWLFLPKPYFEFVDRLASLGEPFLSHRKVAARELIDKGVSSVDEAYLRAAECADAEGRAEALVRIFQSWVWADEPSFVVVQPDLPGHAAFCDCAACEAFRVDLATRRVVALRPFESLSADTKLLVEKVMRLKRTKPILPILEQWAPSLVKQGPPAKPKDPKAPPTPHLDRAEAWLARVQATKTTAGLKKLQKELATIENTDLMDEDGDRWSELIRCVTDHRNTFPASSAQYEVLGCMIDELSST
jgi:hypothetical protein